MRRTALSLGPQAAGLPARTAVYLTLVAFSAFLGCGDDSRPSRPGTANLQIQLVFPDKSLAGAADAAGAASPASVEQIRVSAWELPAGPGRRILQGQDSTTIAPGDLRFRLELSVPPAALYLVQVEARGTLGSPANLSGSGLVFVGSEQIADVVAGDTRTLSITLVRTVPLLTGQVVPTGLSLSWEPVAGAIRYRLREILFSPLRVLETGTSRTDTLIVFPPHAKPSAPEPRVYRVRALLADGLISALSESVTVSVPEPTAPAAIEDLVAVLGTPDAIQLQWTATGNDERIGRASEYDLRRSGSPITTETAFSAAVAIAGLPAPRLSGETETFTVTGLDPDTEYFFAIRAGDEAGLWSALSNSALGSTLPAPPAAPRNLTAEALSESSIGLTWVDQASNETRYRIERKSPSDPGFVLADTLPGAFTDTVRYEDPGLIERTLYAYRVRAENPGGASAWSNQASARTLPAPPRDLAATVAAPDSVALTWSYPFPDPADGFRLERRSGSAEFAEIARPASFDRAFGDDGLQPLGSYTYRLRALDAGDLSEPSDSVQVVMPDRTPACQIEPDTLDFGNVAVGSQLERSFLITNVGGGTLSGSVAATCSAFSILLGGGDFSLGANEVWRVAVQFSPTGTGSQQCTITPTGSCGPVVCTGVGEALPQCAVNPITLAFGTVPVGSTADTTFTISNVGGGILSGDVTTSCPAFSVVSGGTYALAALESQEVTIQFAPQAIGPDSCTVTLTGGCASVACTGSGEGLPLCSVSPPTLDFGTVYVGLDEERTFAIQNVGGGTLTGDVGLMDGCTSYSIVSGGGPFSLGGGESQPVTVRFAPRVEGSAFCNLDLGAIGCSTFSCIGFGDAIPVCAVSPDSLDFGVVPVGTSADTTFTITNEGGGILDGSVSAIDCPYYSVFADSGLRYELGPGESRVVTVRFTPADETLQSCTVNLGSNYCTEEVSCRGRGELHAACTVDPTSLDFGTIEAGERVTRTFTVTNTGGGVLNGLISMPDVCQFEIDAGEGSYSLGPGEVREVTVAFTPSTPGSHECLIDTSCKGGVTCVGTATDPNDHWWPGFLDNAPNGPVKTLALHSSYLAVGGNITAVGDSPTGFLAWWNGSSWIPIVDTPWSDVHVLRAWDDSLYVAGYAVPSAKIAPRVGITVAKLVDGGWSYLVEQLDGGLVDVLLPWQGSFYAGGSFGIPVPQLGYAYSDGWLPASSGFAGNTVSDLEDFGGTLYAAESLVLTSSPGSGAVYRRDGDTWTPVAGTLSGLPLRSVRKLVTHAGALYAIVTTSAGSFVARLDGTTLVPVGETGGDAVLSYFTDLASDGDRLYAVGTFDSVDGVAASRVASWDGTTWRALGSGIAGGPASPTVVLAYRGSIYVGGNFTTAGLKSSPYIARWNP